MSQFLDGEQGALEALVERYQDLLYAFAYRILGSKQAAEDAFQETFLRVYRNSSSYRPGGSFRAWLYRICLNLCRDTLRRRSRRMEVPLKEALLTDDGITGPAERATVLADAARVQRALSSLSRDHREVLLLSHYQGFTQSEIAHTLAIPLGTVKSRHHHAVRKLLATLRK